MQGKHCPGYGILHHIILDFFVKTKINHMK